MHSATPPPSRLASPAPLNRRQNTVEIVAGQSNAQNQNLSDLLRTCRLLTPEQKVLSSTSDSLPNHLYKSRIFKSMVYLIIIDFCAISTMFVWMGIRTQGQGLGQFTILVYGVPGSITLPPIMLAILLPFSQRLKVSAEPRTWGMVVRESNKDIKYQDRCFGKGKSRPLKVRANQDLSDLDRAY